MREGSRDDHSNQTSSILWNSRVDFKVVSQNKQGIHGIAANVQLPWTVLGDFNDIIDDSEKFHRMSAFRDCQLLDLGFYGQKFTWTNKRKKTPILERLDRGLANADWIHLFPNSRLTSLPRLTSNHFLETNKNHKDKKKTDPFASNQYG